MNRDDLKYIIILFIRRNYRLHSAVERGSDAMAFNGSTKLLLASINLIYDIGYSNNLT